jgi:2-dehydropantoate 2-reductase
VRIAVVGAGAIGAYYGPALHRGGTEVHLIARRAHLEAMRENGVRVLSPRGDFTAHPHVTDDPQEIGPVDYVFLGLKAYSYPGWGPSSSPCSVKARPWSRGRTASRGGTSTSCQARMRAAAFEAVDPGGATSAVLPPERAIGCVVYAATVIESPGVIRHLEGTRFSVGEPSGEVSARCTALSAAMIAGRLKSPVEAELRDDIWIKRMGNASFNPISALTGATMAQIYEHLPSRQVVAQVMEEVLDIAARVGSKPGITVERRLRGAGGVGHRKTSMLQDLEAGKQLELDALVTAVVELADMTGAPAPTLRVVHAATDLLARSRSAR